MRRSFFPRFPIRPSTITSPTSRQFPLRLLQSVIDASNPVLRRTVHSNGSTGPYGIKRVTSVLALFRLRFTPRARRTLLSFCLLRFGDLVWPTRLPLPPCHPSLPSSMCHPFSPLWTDATYALPHCSTAWAFIGYHPLLTHTAHPMIQMMFSDSTATPDKRWESNLQFNRVNPRTERSIARGLGDIVGRGRGVSDPDRREPVRKIGGGPANGWRRRRRASRGWAANPHRPGVGAGPVDRGAAVEKIMLAGTKPSMCNGSPRRFNEDPNRQDSLKTRNWISIFQRALQGAGTAARL